MRTILILALLTIVIPACVSAQAQPPAKQSTEQALIKMDRELMDALVKNDQAVADRIETENFVFVNPGGGVEERGKAMAGPAPTFESFDTSEHNVRFNGNTAVLTGKAVVKGKLGNGTDISGTYRYLRVFIKQKGDWRLAATSAVEIRPPRATTATSTPKT
jgi:ketosteroid isomerase-like protein